MFNIFEDQNDPMTEEVKINFMLDKIQYPRIEDNLEALKSSVMT